MKQKISDALARQLTPEEEKALDWLAGWDKETIQTFEGLFSALFKAGQADANAYHEAMREDDAWE